MIFLFERCVPFPSFRHERNLAMTMKLVLIAASVILSNASHTHKGILLGRALRDPPESGRNRSITPLSHLPVL